MNLNTPRRESFKPLNTYIIFLLLIASSLPLRAQAGASSAAGTINLNYQKVTAAILLNDIASQSGYTISFNAPLFEKFLLNRIQYKNAPLNIILKELEKESKLSFMVSGNHISAIINEKKEINQQPGRISGKVVDDKGESLPGASIRIIELNKGITSSVDGSYQFNVEPGTYTLEISYISYQTKRIADITVRAGQLVKLDIVLNVATSALKEVVIQSSYKKESIAGLYAQQKNNASMTDGISAEQISRTPDNNVGTVLKRVSGVNTVDNKYVMVRGMGERNNQAMIDGIVLPSTDMNRRNFSFDVVPVELISSVVVNKTSTPDASSDFAGGQVTVNTLAIPEENFTSFTIGSGFNTRTTGKDFIQAGGRGDYDYFAFDDGRRKKPEGIKSWLFKAGASNDNPLDYVTGALEQSKKFNPDGFKLYQNTASPNQSYRFTLGKLYSINEKLKIGFVGGLTYRNTREINDYQTSRGWAQDNYFSDTARYDPATGKIYKFTTNWGAVFNTGLQGEKFKLTLRNLYTRMLNDDLYDLYGRRFDNIERKERSIFVDPVFTAILQNKLEGEHSIGRKGMLLNWSGSRTNISQEHKDLRNFTYFLTSTIGGQDLYQTPGLSDNNNVTNIFDNDYRLWTSVNQTDYNWFLSLSQPFNFLKDKSLVKVGYTGWFKHREQNTLAARLFTKYTGSFFDPKEPYENILSPDRIGYGQDMAYYYADAENGGDVYNGNSRYHAAFLMLDQRFFQKLRLVYGVRAENFNLKNRQLNEIERRRIIQEQYGDDVTIINPKPLETGEDNWNFLPSVNLTYSLTSKMNIRAAYSRTMIRPDLRETASMAFVDPLLQGAISGGNIASTKIDNYDLRYEWYPSSGEIFSVSGFYKKFDKPVELMKSTNLNNYFFKNQKSATNLGIEMEVRKSLSFIADKQWLQDLSLFGNATLMKSEVTQINEQDKVLLVKRPLFGQSPYIVNGGINYTSKYFGLNAVYNRSGHRTYTVEDDPRVTEYENGRDLIDLQLNTRLLKQRAEIRLNISNLLDNAAMYYVNPTGYETIRDPNDLQNSSEKLVNGTTGYEKDKDFVRHKIKYGRTINLTFTYNF